MLANFAREYGGYRFGEVNLELHKKWLKSQLDSCRARSTCGLAMVVDATTILSAFATCVSAGAAVFSAVSSRRAAKAAADSIAATKSIAETQRMLSQRQLLVPLWEHMTSVNEIDPSNPSVSDVREGIHALELVAVCCEGGMVDENVIKRTFRDVFIKTYDQISSCPEMPALRRDGKAILRENPAAMRFYEVLMSEHRDRDKLRKE